VRRGLVSKVKMTLLDVRLSPCLVKMFSTSEEREYMCQKLKEWLESEWRGNALKFGGGPAASERGASKRLAETSVTPNKSRKAARAGGAGGATWGN
jgi:hypothetical protein